MEKEVDRPLYYRIFLKWILGRQVYVITIIAAVSLLFLSQIPKLTFNTSIYDLIIEDLPETARYNELRKIYGSDEIIRVVIKGDRIYDPITFGKIEKLAGTAAGIEGVKRVISLPDVKRSIDVTGDMTLEEFASLMSPVKLFHRNLISEDRKTTVLTLVLKNDASQEAVIKKVDEIIVNAPENLSLYQIGMPLVSQALAKFTEKDFCRLPPVTYLVIACILFCCSGDLYI